MIARALFTLAARGYAFPKPDALRVSHEYRPATYPMVRCRVLKPFHALRRVLEPGEIVALSEPDAADAAHLGRVRLL